MLENRNWKTDLAALGLLSLTLFLALALFTYDPADPPTSLVYPANESARNACGAIGAVTASWLLHGIGVSAYLALFALILVDAKLLIGKPPREPYLQTVGWMMAGVGLSTLTQLLFPYWGIDTVLGPGGYLGAAFGMLLETQFAFAGGMLLSTSVLAAGLLLASDGFLLRVMRSPLAFTAAVFGSILRIGREGFSRWRERARDRREGKEVAIRISGRKAGRHTDVDEAPELDEEAEAVEEEEESFDEIRVNTPPPKSERQAVMEELDAASRDAPEEQDYELPSVQMLEESEDINYDQHEQDVRNKAKILEETFANFGFNVKVVEIDTGPVIAQFEIKLEAGLRLSKITSLADDLAIALRVPSVRIVAPIPGKNTVGIEVPNVERQLVRMREVMEETDKSDARMHLPIFLGKDVSGNPLTCDLAKMPHLLIAGRTGTGKSVCLNSIISSLLMTKRPDEVKMLLIDPKMVELSCYKRIPHLMHPVVTDMKKAEAILAWAVDKMEERYQLLSRAGVRHISGYNQLSEEELHRRIQPENEEEKKEIPAQLPYIVIVADEMADLMMTAAKEVETHIIRLAQKSRAVGIHLVLATQKPTVDVITGLIKSNLPARISFQVASRTDSRVVLDEMGAEKLLGNGDMLFLWPGTSMLLRGQGTYISDDEINDIVDFVGQHEPTFAHELVALKPKDDDKTPGLNQNRDDLYESAIDVVVSEGRGSVSLLQRSLGIGYGRAARMVDYMAEDGIVGEYNGSQAREVLITAEQWEAMKSGESAEPARKPRRNVIQLEPSEEGTYEEEDYEEADYDEGDFDEEDVLDEEDEYEEDDEEEYEEAPFDEADEAEYEKESA